jgi:sulfite exporter TauE/SafE
VDWKVAARYAVIGALIIGAVMLAVMVFYRVWYEAGVVAAVLLVVAGLYAVNRWSKMRAAWERAKVERS